MPRSPDRRAGDAMDNGRGAMPSQEDLLSQLTQKENDLVLAAELGKALLEKNEELKRHAEHVTEECNRKLERDSSLLSFSTYTSASGSGSGSANPSGSYTAAPAPAPTARSVKESKEVEQERHLLRRRLANKESELEARIVELQNDVVELQERLQGKETQLKQLERDKGALVGDLRAQNHRLTEQLKTATALEGQLRQQLEGLREQFQMGKSSLAEHMSSVDSLKDELDIVEEKNRELERRLQVAAMERDSLAAALEEASDKVLMLERQIREQDLRMQHQAMSYPSLPQDKLSIEDKMAAMASKGDPPLSLHAELDLQTDGALLAQECMSAYRQLRSLVTQLRAHGRGEEDSGLHSDCSATSLPGEERETPSGAAFTAGLLGEAAQELVGLVLDTDAVRLLERLDQARREVAERDQEIAARGHGLAEMQARCGELEVRLSATEEERDRARDDASHSSLARDEAVLKARDERDKAMERRTKAEMELARARVELMQSNSQLLESIQQKVELSQQLDQWQIDMQELIDEQLRSKLSQHEVKSRSSAGTPVAPLPAPRHRRLLKFFQR